MGNIDLEEFGRRLMAQMDHRVDYELTHIRQESSSAMESSTKEVKNQLRQNREQIA